MVKIRDILGATALAVVAGFGVASAVEIDREDFSGTNYVAAAPSYDRSEFGASGWIDEDRDCQDTRQEILIRDMEPERLTKNRCIVIEGVLQDPYTGERIDFKRGMDTSADVQIDHIVPLKAAWEMGAYEWSETERVTFANDPNNLRAVDGPTNGSKGDKTISEWLPPNPASHCDYARSWATLLDTYPLDESAADRATIDRVLSRC
jgi:hypothetical protein